MTIKRRQRTVPRGNDGYNEDCNPTARETFVNTKTRRRLVLVTLIIVVVAVVAFAYAGASGAARSVSVAEATSGNYADQRIEVSGTVVDDSFSLRGNTLSFAIYDPEKTDGTTLDVVYDGTAATTFGNGVVAICTGKLDTSGVLLASELVTKCPSKYESAEGAVTADYLVKQGTVLVGQELRLAGYVKPGTLVAVGGDERFVLYSQGAEISVRFDGALSEEVTDDSAVVCTGTLDSAGVFVATDIALEDID
jgi:cytochrome c-type biogenesis protein CcmE